MLVRITINLDSELLIAQRRGTGNFIRGADFIPGTIIRGLVATAMLEKYYSREKKEWVNKNKDEERFYRLFFTPKTRFGNLYIGGLKTKVLPKTARSCKYYPGFHSPKSHGLWDFLIPSLVYDRNGQWDERYERCASLIFSQGVSNPCGSLIDHISGYYEGNGQDNELPEVKKRIITHTRISDGRGSAMPGALFSQEVISEGAEQNFTGLIEGEEGDLVFIQALLKEAEEEGALRIGSDKTRGMGKICLLSSELIKDSQTGKETGLKNRFGFDLKKRFDGFNSAIDSAINKKNSVGQGQEPSLCFFSITLDSEVIILDNFLRYKGYLDISDLVSEFCYSELLNSDSEMQRILSKILARFKLETHFHTIQIVSGWDMATGFPKEDRLAISKGSVFLYSLKDGETMGQDERELLINGLSKLEEQGIGEGKNEGFGQITICDPFHWEGGWPK